jgi:hypothetical protein
MFRKGIQWSGDKHVARNAAKGIEMQLHLCHFSIRAIEL